MVFITSPLIGELEMRPIYNNASLELSEQRMTQSVKDISMHTNFAATIYEKLLTSIKENFQFYPQRVIQEVEVEVEVEGPWLPLQGCPAKNPVVVIRNVEILVNWSRKVG